MLTKLRRLRFLEGNNKTIAMACKDAEMEGQLGDECLNGEIFYGLREAQVIIENWRTRYDAKHPPLST